MQKAFERIVERLEEEYNKWVDIYNLDKCKGAINDYADGKSDGFANAVEIVNQVAEEHEKEVCEWEFYHVSAGVTFFKTCAEVMPYIFKENKKYCPYCGKRIYVKGE